MSDQVYTGKARIRARDIRQTLQGKIDPALLTTLETLAEQDGTLRQQIDMLATLVNKCIDQIQFLQMIIGQIKDNPDLLKGADAIKEVKDTALNRIKVVGEDESGDR